MGTKEDLLEFLKQEKDNWISGEKLSERLHITRSAVWKHIKVLRDEGYKIESSPNKGYHFKEISENLLPNEIRAHLQTKTFGRKDILYIKEIDSTNLRAKELASKGAPEGTIVISERQTDGRGRKGREWFSPRQDGIYMSILLRPAIPPNEAPKITLLTGVALAEALISLTGLDIHIKWPNDILLNNKKVAGILTEISTEMDAIDFIVVGIGINVNTDQFPHDLKQKATSLYIASGKRFQRINVISEFLQYYENYYNGFKESGFTAVLKRWKELSNIFNRNVRVEMIDQTITGTVKGIDGEGALLIEDREGMQHWIYSGDIILI